VATDHLLDFLKVYAPAPIEREPVAARAVLNAVAAGANGEAKTGDGGNGPEIVMRKVDDAEPLSMYVFKTMTDPFAGRITFFKVFSGVLRNDAAVQNYSRRTAEKLSHLSVMQGRTAVPVSEIHAGDLGAVAKLRETLTGDTLGDKSHEIFFEPVALPEPAMTWAIEPKSRADEDKLAPAVHKLMEEDLMVRFFRDQQTNEFLIAAAGRAVSGDDPGARRCPGAAQKTDRRPRAVRRLQNQNGAAGARGRIRV
jgi:elongation factor G